MKVGDKLTIHCYKHNGKIDRISGEAIVLDETDEYLVCANNKVKLIENDGRSHRTKEIAILFFYKKEWYNILAQLKKYGLFYYCNIASPYIIDGNIIKYIDYDLDLRIFPDGTFKVLDKNEYRYHKILFFLKKVQKSVDNEKIVWYINFALEKRSARSSLKTK